MNFKLFGSIAIFIFVLAITACSEKQDGLELMESAGRDSQQTSRAAQELLDSDRSEPISDPKMPLELEEVERSRPEILSTRDSALVVDYSVECESADAPELAAEFMSTSRLISLQDVPIHTIMALQERLKGSLREGRNILHAYGYYAGELRGWIEGSGERFATGSVEVRSEEELKHKQIVRIVFTPGPQYSIGETKVIRLNIEQKRDRSDIRGDEVRLAGITPEEESRLPRTLADVGLKGGMPAVAKDVLKAVNLVVAAFQNNGYPFAKIEYTRYILDNEKQTLEATVGITPFEFMRMGGIDLSGDENKVNASYIEYLKTWENGEPWNQSKIEKFRNALRQSGLFQSIDLKPATMPNKEGEYATSTTLKSAFERTIGASVRYDTGFGLGLQAYWENRNFTGDGDLLRTELSIWKDLQEMVARYRLPFVFGPEYDFIAQAGVIHQDTDAYKLESASTTAGIEWHVSRNWNLSVQGTAEGGRGKDPGKKRREYLMLGVPLSANFSSTNSLLDATDGGRALFSVLPYTGYYGENFNVVRSRIDLQRFIPFAEKDKFVLALRGSVGGLFGAEAPEVPPSVRFYGGGGGSVRGYEYQSLGPRNADKDPLGGSSMLEVSVEPRYRINDTFGIVAFIDGGMVYEDWSDSSFGQDMRWGTGVGVRFYTAIGPVRLDIATPINPRRGDSAIHMYISIGQSF